MRLHEAEIREFLNSYSLVDVAKDEFDECSNHWETKVYCHDGRYYALEFCNARPCKSMGSDEYELKEVEHKERTVKYWAYI